MKRLYTAESVTEGHPDKLCDLIADSILDECLKFDPDSRVACEVLATKGMLLAAGEITSTHEPYVFEVMEKVLSDVGYSTDNIQMDALIHQQSPDIAKAVDCSREKRCGLPPNQTGWENGAGDQGVMIGYACDETPQFLPMPVVLANRIVRELTASRRSHFIEAVLCVPLFLYAAVSLIWMLELRSIQSAVRCGLQSAGKQVAESFAEIPVLNPISLHADLVNAVGKERMDRSMIVGGSGGVSCKRSWAIPGMGVLELTAEYEVELPVPVFHIPVLHYKEKMRMKTWTGYVKTYEAGIGDNELVYVTETGIVYHRNYQCTYLEPSVRSVAKTQLGELRNSSGGIYHLCERCGWMPGNDGNCYVTDYGDRYHTSLSCSGLKRKVYTVPLSEVKGKGACSKCGGK